jgi:LytS/YehU family sensor histidine kinase
MVDQNELHFSVANAVPEKIPIPTEKAGGIGLENLRRRLQLLYPEKHMLQIDKKETEFLANMVLKLNT